jgi:dTDP-4-dehydrorhamnose reductase
MCWSVLKAAQGCKGVFLNTYPSSTDINSEGQQAKLVLEACKKAGVEIVVASTSFKTGDRDMWDNADSRELVGPYYQSKSNIEEAVRGAGLKTYTILRPAFIHHDYVLPYVAWNYPDLPKSGTLGHAFNDGVGLLHIDPQDIGRYAAAALLDPVKFGGQEIELANECLTIEEVRDMMVKATGRDVKVKKWNAEEIKVAKTSILTVHFELWANIKTQTSSAKATEEKFGIPFTSLEKYFQREKAKLLECLPDATQLKESTS